MFSLRSKHHAPNCTPPEGKENLPQFFKAFRIVIFLCDVLTYAAVLCYASQSRANHESSPEPRLQVCPTCKQDFFSCSYIKIETLTDKHRWVQSRYSFGRIFRIQPNKCYLIFFRIFYEESFFLANLPIWKDLWSTSHWLRPTEERLLKKLHINAYSHLINLQSDPVGNHWIPSEEYQFVYLLSWCWVHKWAQLWNALLKKYVTLKLNFRFIKQSFESVTLSHVLLSTWTCLPN